MDDQQPNEKARVLSYEEQWNEYRECSPADLYAFQRVLEGHSRALEKIRKDHLQQFMHLRSKLLSEGGGRENDEAIKILEERLARAKNELEGFESHPTYRDIFARRHAVGGLLWYCTYNPKNTPPRYEELDETSRSVVDELKDNRKVHLFDNLPVGTRLRTARNEYVRKLFNEVRPGSKSDSDAYRKVHAKLAEKIKSQPEDGKWPTAGVSAVKAIIKRAGTE